MERITRSLIQAALLVAIVSAVHSRDFFRAAVMEHRPRASNNSGLSANEIIARNLPFYEKAVELAAKQDADIIVFNEYGLFPYPGSREKFHDFAQNIPDPRTHRFNPCTQNDKQHILYTLSCAARKNNIYLVANMADGRQCEGTCDNSGVENCNSCPSDGFFFYNTNVAFDREGNIVARYHKVHPYFEQVNVPTEPEFITFDTEFGRFGLIICFDSVFEESVQLVKEYKIDALLFPTFWFDDIVPLSAVEWQQAWALANKVHFIASNTQSPGYGSLGSGIYSRDEGALVYTYEPDGHSKLLISNLKLTDSSEVPKNDSLFIITEDKIFPKVETGEAFPEQGYEKVIGPTANTFSEYRYFKSKTDNYTKVKLTEPSGEIEACNNGFCCSLSYASNGIQDNFYLVTFSGYNNVREYYHWWEENCILIRCDPFEDEECKLHTPKSTTTFKSVKLHAQFSQGIVYAAVSKNYNRLASTREWHYGTDNSGTKLSFTAANDEPLIKVAMMGRIYERDPPYVPYHKF